MILFFEEMESKMKGLSNQIVEAGNLYVFETEIIYSIPWLIHRPYTYGILRYCNDGNDSWKAEKSVS